MAASGQLTLSAPNGASWGADTTTGAWVPNTDNALADGSTALRKSNDISVIQTVQGAYGESMALCSISEEITLATGGLTTDSTANLLPANSFIMQVVAYVTTTITTATGWKLGDATTTGRFLANTTNLTAGSTGYGAVHMQGGISTDAAGQYQTAAAKLRITAATSNPGAGKIRVTVFYIQATAPTS